MLSYTISSLSPGQSVTFYVRAVTTVSCQTSPNLVVVGTAKVCPVLAVPSVTVSDSTLGSVTFLWSGTAGTIYAVTYNSTVV